MLGLHSHCTREKARRSPVETVTSVSSPLNKTGSNGYRTLAISYVVFYTPSEAPLTGPTENMKEYGHILWLLCQATVPRFQK